jgi:cobalt-zinc-cadmium efflux system membrane fusion protein
MRRVTRDGTAPMVEMTKSSWERGKALHEKSEGISMSEVQKREAEYKGALAAQLAANAAVESSQHRLQLFGMTPQAIETLATSKAIAPTFTIAAPIAGRIVEREATMGELVDSDREPLCVIADMSTLWIVAEVAEARFSDVRVGAAALVSGGADSSKRIQGRVALIAPHVDADTRTIHVRIEVPATALALVPGMFARAEIAIDGTSDAPAPVLAIPDEAIQTIEGATCVFVPVEGEANTFAARRIVAGKRVAGLVPVESGLTEGERFVASGLVHPEGRLGKSTASHED